MSRSKCRTCLAKRQGERRGRTKREDRGTKTEDSAVERPEDEIQYPISVVDEKRTEATLLGGPIGEDVVSGSVSKREFDWKIVKVER